LQIHTIPIGTKSPGSWIGHILYARQRPKGVMLNKGLGQQEYSESLAFCFLKRTVIEFVFKHFLKVRFKYKFPYHKYPDNWHREKDCSIEHTRGLELWCLMPLSTISQLFRGGHFIGGGNRSIERKPPTCRKSLTNFFLHNVELSTPRHDRDSNSQL
jgi:hypothetical protein